MTFDLDDVRIRAVEPLLSPNELKQKLPISPEVAETVALSRIAITEVIQGTSKRYLSIVGPCSIHDPEGGLVYAEKLAKVSKEVEDVLLVVMRVYFEKPRTTVGWKGLVSDPNLDGSDDIAKGLRIARSFLLEVGKLGLPAATEFLDPIVPQYIADLISWAAIGARTTESQTHREMSSGLSMPVGFKNGTDGDYQSALDAMLSARSAHSFLGLSSDGQVSIIRTQGQPTSHLVLRGGRKHSNCDPATMTEALAKNGQDGAECRAAGRLQPREFQQAGARSAADLEGNLAVPAGAGAAGFRRDAGIVSGNWTAGYCAESAAEAGGFHYRSVPGLGGNRAAFAGKRRANPAWEIARLMPAGA